MAQVTPHKILIVDDHIETLQIIAKVLEQNGFETVKARSGLQGLSLVGVEDPDLIMLDGMMPEMDGWEVCRRLREQPRFASIPIIMFSAIDEAEQKLAGFDAGADDYLTKPTDPEEMLERVHAMLENLPPKAAARRQTAVVEPEKPGTDPMKTRALAARQDITVVMGSRGGAGVTTLAINLAATKARIHQPTTLIDLGLPGHVATYLNQKNPPNFFELQQEPVDELPRLLPEYLVSYSGGMQLLLQKRLLEHRPTAWPEAHFRRLLDSLLQAGHKIVIDLAVTQHALLPAILPLAGSLLLCTRPERIALAAAREMLAGGETMLVPPERRHLVVMDFSGQMQVPREALEKYLRQRIDAIVPVSPGEMTHAVNKGRPLVHAKPQSKAAQALALLAKQLA